MSQIATFIRKIEVESYGRELSRSEAHAFALACQITDGSKDYQVRAVVSLIEGLRAH